MRRRRLLGIATALPLAGCLGTLRPPRAGTAVEPCGSPGDAPEPRDVCPGADPERIVWGREATAGTPVRMVAGRTAATLPVEDLRFTFHNDSGRTALLNPYAWGLWRWTGDGWTSATRRIVPKPLLFLPSGRSYAWRLSATQGPPDAEPVAGDDASESIRLEGLAGGTYAFAIDVDLGRGEETPERDDRRITAAALVGLRRNG